MKGKVRDSHKLIGLWTEPEQIGSKKHHEKQAIIRELIGETIHTLPSIFSCREEVIFGSNGGITMITDWGEERLRNTMRLARNRAVECLLANALISAIKQNSGIANCTKVVVHGLKAKQYNGMFGIVMNALSKAGESTAERITVKLNGIEGNKRIKPKNLVIYSHCLQAAPKAPNEHTGSLETSASSSAKV